MVSPLWGLDPRRTDLLLALPLRMEPPVDSLGRLKRGWLPGWWPETSRHLVALVLRDGPDCRYCGVLLTPDTWSRDHVVPRKYRGPTKIGNLVLACLSCNSRKGARLWPTPV